MGGRAWNRCRMFEWRRRARHECLPYFALLDYSEAFGAHDGVEGPTLL